MAHTHIPKKRALESATYGCCALKSEHLETEECSDLNELAYQNLLEQCCKLISETMVNFPKKVNHADEAGDEDEDDFDEDEEDDDFDDEDDFDEDDFDDDEDDFDDDEDDFDDYDEDEDDDDFDEDEDDEDEDEEEEE